MIEGIKSSIDFYKLCNRLKDTIRKGPTVWNIKRNRVESVAEHVYGVQMLAIAIYYQFHYKFDLEKVLYMLAIHELEEIIIGDLAFYEETRDNKLKIGKEATDTILKDILGKEEIDKLLDEFNERETKEAKFAYHCDKLECDIQIKLYDQEGCFDLNNQANNPLLKEPRVIEKLSHANKLSDAWLETDKPKYSDDPVFMEFINYLMENDI